MSTGDGDDNSNYRVLVNHEGQYSIWLAERENGRGIGQEERVSLAAGAESDARIVLALIRFKSEGQLAVLSSDRGIGGGHSRLLAEGVASAQGQQ